MVIIYLVLGNERSSQGRRVTRFKLETVMTLNLIELARVLFDTTLLTLLPV